jgi:hypothetical protein
VKASFTQNDGELPPKIKSYISKREEINNESLFEEVNPREKFNC